MFLLRFLSSHRGEIRQDRRIYSTEKSLLINTKMIVLGWNFALFFFWIFRFNLILPFHSSHIFWLENTWGMTLYTKIMPGGWHFSRWEDPEKLVPVLDTRITNIKTEKIIKNDQKRNRNIKLKIFANEKLFSLIFNEKEWLPWRN